MSVSELKAFLDRLNRFSSVRRNKKKYRLQNWKDYNKGLKKRGDITFWINPDTLKQWQYKGKRVHGGHCIYSWNR